MESDRRLPSGGQAGSMKLLRASRGLVVAYLLSRGTVVSVGTVLFWVEQQEVNKQLPNSTRRAEMMSFFIEKMGEPSSLGAPNENCKPLSLRLAASRVCLGPW